MVPELLFKCLSDSTRLMLVLRIRNQGEACVCELMDDLGRNQPTISRHLAQLRNCGILKDRRDSQWVYYSIDPEIPAWALSIIDTAMESGSHEFSSFCKSQRNLSTEREIKSTGRNTPN